MVRHHTHTSKSRRAFFAHALEYVGLKIRNGRGIAKPRLERAWKTIGGRGEGEVREGETRLNVGDEGDIPFPPISILVKISRA